MATCLQYVNKVLLFIYYLFIIIIIIFMIIFITTIIVMIITMIISLSIVFWIQLEFRKAAFWLEEKTRKTGVPRGKPLVWRKGKNQQQTN